MSSILQKSETSVRTSERTFREQLFSGATGERVISILSPILLLVLWEILGRVRLLDQRFFPVPTAIVSTFIHLLSNGELMGHTTMTMTRVAIGFAAGALPALALGIAMGLSRYIRAALKPMVGALYPIPKTAIFPLLLVLFGLGESSKYIFVAIGVFFIVLLNTLAGVLSIDIVYFEVGKNFGADARNVFFTIAFPGALPLIFAGLRLAWGNALLLIVVAEQLGARNGLGAFIWNSWQTFSVEPMYVGVVTISIIGYVSFLIFDELERWLIPWEEKQSR